MRADGTIVNISKTGSAPEIELIFGNAQWGKYEVQLWNTSGQVTIVRRGLNTDQISDKFPISGSAAELDGFLLVWDTTIGALGGLQGQQFSLQIVLTQDGRPLTGSPFEYSGPLDGTAKVADFVTLRTV